MHSELRLTPLPTPQFWDIQDAGWPTGNDTSGHVEVPLDSHPAPSEACSVAAKLSLCPLPGFTPGLARDRGMFTKQDASRASLTCVTERRGPLSGTLGYRGEGHFVNLMFSPAVSSVFYFFCFSKVYIRFKLLFYSSLSGLDNGNQLQNPSHQLHACPHSFPRFSLYTVATVISP